MHIVLPERVRHLSRVALWLCHLLIVIVRRAPRTPQFWERGTKSLLKRMPPHLLSLQTIDTFGVRVGWQVQLVLLFQSRWHEATPQVVVTTSKLGCRLFGCCQGDEQVWLDPSRASLLHVPS